VNRLSQLAIDRQAIVSSEALKQFASSLSGFSENAIDLACYRLGEATIGTYETRWPEKAKFLQACRDAEQEIGAPKEKKPFCPECENENGYLFFDKEYRGNRLRGAEIASRAPGDRFACRCPCGGSYRQDRPEKHYSMQDVMKEYAKRSA
jgi:hypothetical protein